MRMTRRGLVLGLLVVAALGLGVGVVRRVRHALPKGAMHGEHGAAVYYCPMHPGYTSDHPGDCPICSMKLVKRESSTAPMGGAHEGHEPAAAGGVEGYAAVTLTPQQQQLIGVRTAAVERRAMTKTIRTVGRVAYDPELYQAQQEYLQAARALAAAAADTAESARQVAEAARLRLRLLGLSEPFIEEMASWEGPDQRLLLTDPTGGVWVYATVYEFELPYVLAGQAMAVEVPSRPGLRLEGMVASVDPVLDPTTRSARVRALLHDPEGRLQPGMYVDAWLAAPLGEQVVLPAEAVLQTGTRAIVFVDQGQGRLEPREVSVGVKADGVYAVAKGVAEGERVVVSGNFLVDSESRLKGALERPGPPAAGHEHGGQQPMPPQAHQGRQHDQ